MWITTLTLVAAAATPKYYTLNFIEGQLYDVDCSSDQNPVCQSQCEEAFQCEEADCRLMPKPLIEDAMALVNTDCVFKVNADLSEEMRVPVLAVTGIPPNATAGMTSVIFSSDGLRSSLGSWHEEFSELTFAIEFDTPLWGTQPAVEEMLSLDAEVYRARLGGAQRTGLCSMDADAPSVPLTFTMEYDDGIRAVADWSDVLNARLEDNTWFAPNDPQINWCVNIKWQPEWNGLKLATPSGLQSRSMIYSGLRVRGGSTAEIFLASVDPESPCESCLASGKIRCALTDVLAKYDPYFNPDPVGQYTDWTELASTASERNTVAYFGNERCVPTAESCDGRLVTEC